MSLRAELVRLGLRWFVKRKIGPATTLQALRRQDAFLERLVPPPPKGTQATHVDLDGVKAVAVVAPASHGVRLVLYLHGGGHVSGSPALYGDFIWRIAAATRARTVILDHRLAPAPVSGGARRCRHGLPGAGGRWCRPAENGGTRRVLRRRTRLGDAAQTA
jgi:acetyl esterase/lipase